MKRIGKWLQDQTLLVKILLVVSVACCAVAVSCFSILGLVYNSYDKQLYIKTAQAYTALVEQNETELQNLQNVTLAIVGDPTVQKNLTIIHTEQPGTRDWLESKRNLSTVVGSYMRNSEQVSKYTVYSGGEIIAGNRFFLDSSDLETLMLAAQKAEGALSIIRCGNKLYFARQIRQTANFAFDELATIVGSLDISGLIHRSTAAYTQAGVTLDLMVWVDGESVYGENADISLLPHDGWEIQGNNFVVQCTNDRGWVYLFYTPYDEIHSAIKTTKAVSIIFVVLVTAIALLVSYIVIQRITCHLERLVEKMDDYSHGKLPTEEEMQKYRERRDEIGRLHRHFDHMAYENRRIVEENYNHMLIEKESQYKQLQYQVQPHFIFNSLSVIMSIAYENNDLKVVKLSTALSSLLRESMSAGSDLVSVKKECHIIEEYILIQKERFGDKLNFEMSIPPELLEYHIPKMTLQPLVDNAVKYALEDMLDPCYIRVFGKKEPDCVKFVVEDNGPGMQENILSELQEKRINAKGNGIGLLNIQKRLQMAFSEQYGLEIHRVLDKTQVWVRIPLDCKEKSNVQFNVR